MISIQEYQKYYIDRDYEQIDLFRLLKKTYDIERVIYPGSYIHVSPSLIFSDVVYIDSNRKARGKYRISNTSLVDFFVPKGKTLVTKELLQKTGKGVGYVKAAPLYIFQRVS